MIRAVAFDLDGTLVDSRRDLVTAVNGLRSELSFGPLAEAEVIAKIGHGARDLVRRSLPDALRGEAFELAFQRFSERYFDVCLEATQPYAGVPELLATLFTAGFSLAVVTNKPERPTNKILDGLGLAQFFEIVLGGDSLATRKPDPGPLLEAARRLAVSPREIVLVGDSAVDAETARAAGSPFIQVSWGFGVAQELAAYDPWLVANTAQPIAAALLATRSN